MTLNIQYLEETIKPLKNFKKVGILSSKRTKDSRLYNNLLRNVQIIYPNEYEQKSVSKIIIKIINRSYINSDKKRIEEIIANLKNRGAEKIVLACTDLANIIELDDSIIDTQEVLINSIKNKMKEN